MGCTQSKIENEEAVGRCKERKQFMKEAVASRNAFAAAHSAYAMALKNTGAALSDYAHGEVYSSSAAASVPSSSSVPASVAAVASQPPFDSLLPPPPPPSLSAEPPPQPLHRAATMPQFSIPKPETGGQSTIMEGDEDEEEMETQEKLIRKRSSRSNKGGSDGARIGRSVEDPEPVSRPQTINTTIGHGQEEGILGYIFSPVENMTGPSLEEVKVVEKKTEEVERTAVEERSKRDEDAAKAAEAVVAAEKEKEKAVEAAAGPLAKGSVKKGRVVAEGKRVVKGNVNLLQIFGELDDHFLKASQSAYEVSKMLEATRLHYHSNFADNRGHINHSARVMRVITWNRSFRGLPNVDDKADDFDSEEHETHATVLDKLLAWEKKLYDEVKAGELMKFEYQKKVALLNKQKKRGTNSDSLERTKAAVSHLHTRYIVDMQSMDSTVSEINRLRDQQLYPKLVQLVDGMATMWETMQFHHESQSKIVTALKYLDISQSQKETSEHHHERTIQLWAIVQEWHGQFCKLIDNQKGYLKALNNWLKLNLIPIESSLKEKVSSPPRVQSPPIQALVIAWHDGLDKLPDEVARSAIFNFAAVINTIMHHQEEEMKMKEKCEETRKELGRKDRQFEDWHRKYMQRRTPEELDPEDNTHEDAIAERRLAVEIVKKRLEEEEENYIKQCLQVREKSLTSLKTRLPELFRAMSDVALNFSEMYKGLRSITQHRNRSEDTS